MKDDRFLTDEELERLTDCRRASLQVDRLKKLGIPLRLSPSGKPVVKLSWVTPEGERVHRPKLEMVR